MKHTVHKTALECVLTVILWLSVCLTPHAAGAAEANVVGKWIVPGGDAVVSITGTGDSISLVLLKMLEPGGLDSNNPDSGKQSRSLEGLMIGDGFQQEGGTWRGGSLYDPDSGNTYKASLSLIDENRLLLRGFIGISLIGRSQTWTRFDYFKDRMLQMLEADCCDGGCHD